MANYLLNELFVRLVQITEQGTETLPFIINRGGNNITRIPDWKKHMDYRPGTCVIHKDQIYNTFSAVIGKPVFDPSEWMLIDPFNYFVKTHRIDKEYNPGTIVLHDNRCFINREFCLGEFNDNEWDSLVEGYRIETCNGYMTYSDGSFKQFDFSGIIITI
jgi:hypothetical protein